MTPTEIAKWLERFFVRHEEYRPKWGSESLVHDGMCWRWSETRRVCVFNDALAHCTLAVEEWLNSKGVFIIGKRAHTITGAERKVWSLCTAPTRILADIEAVKKIEGATP